jgi:hypothetical protein
MQRSLTMLGVLLAIVTACTDSTGPEVLTTDALVGTWHLTSLTYTSYATPVQVRQRLDSTDIISDIITIDASAGYTRVLTHAWFGPIADTGVVLVRNDTFFIQSKFLPPGNGSPHPRLTGRTLVLQDSVFDYLWASSERPEAYRYKEVYTRQ